jgi:hypothetical protein
MKRTLFALTPVSTGVARPCALGDGYAWRFHKSQVNVIPMAGTATARRLRRPPT